MRLRSLGGRKKVREAWHMELSTELFRLLTLQDSNTRVVLFGTTVLGLAAGAIGVFALLRKRALVGDALSHAALPGLCVAFLVSQRKELSILLAGAFISGLIGMALIVVISRFTRVREDAAIGIVLSAFFGLGICLSRIVQSSSIGDQAGLDTYIYGRAASMLRSDAELISVVAATVIATVVLFFKEFKLICFDQGFSRANGWPVGLLDGLIMGAVVLTTIVGLQAVGVVLVIALLIIPAATARLWTDRLSLMVAISAVIGALSAVIGTAISALVPQLPTGPLIVLVAAGVFVVTVFVSPERGVLGRAVRHFRLRRKIAVQHLLRAVFEINERRSDSSSDAVTAHHASLAHHVSLAQLRNKRSWSDEELNRAVELARQRGLVEVSGEIVEFTAIGARAAAEVVRNHRLWELYLIKYADTAPANVDRSADSLEHVLPKQLLDELSQLLELGQTSAGMPPSPHKIGPTEVECK